MLAAGATIWLTIHYNRDKQRLIKETADTFLNKIVEDEKNHKLVWECPNCGNRDQNKMNVVRRTCGYLGTNFWNQGRTQEIRDRVVHLSDN